jgi:integrase
MKYNAENERVKRQYFTFLKEAKRQNESSVDAVAMALYRFEDYNKYKSFKTFHFKQAVGFKNFLAKQKSKQSGELYSKSTINSTLRHLKVFFQWLYSQAGYKSKINYTHTEYFNLSEKETRVATAKRSRPVPTIEQIKHVINSLPFETVLEKRNRALIAFTLLTGMRDKAIASLKIKHVNLDDGVVFQDARDVDTKFSKTFNTYFFPIDDEIKNMVSDWIVFLKTTLLFGEDDPVFPKTQIVVGDDGKFKAMNVMPEHWSNASPIRRIFKESFKQAGLAYFNPHSFRNTLAKYGERICQSAEEFKAWSQNLGHEGVLTTFFSYGEVQQDRQAEIMKHLKLSSNVDNKETVRIVKELIDKMARAQLDNPIKQSPVLGDRL